MIPVLTDSHAGYADDKPVYYDLMAKFYDECFFPVIDELGSRVVVHIGDILDRRKYVKFSTLHRLRVDFLDKLRDRGIKLILVLGNHDVVYKHTNQLNGPTELWGNSKYDIDIISEPTTVELDGCEIALVPWICQENRTRTLEFIQNTTAQVLFGHLELSGFEWYKGAVADHGDDPNTFARFDVVASGHYHHKSQKGNVHYLGSPFQLNWSDYNDLRGFHLFDPESRRFDFVPNTFEPFIKFLYDDANMTVEEMMSINLDRYRGKFVKVVVIHKKNPFIFDILLDRLEKLGLLELQVVEDHMNMDQASDEELVDSTEDTLTMLNNFVEAIPFGLDKKALQRTLHDIYIESLTVDA